MDLREVLAEALAKHRHEHLCVERGEAADPIDDLCLALGRVQADAALARLSQPDVLDVFERRVGRAIADVRSANRGVRLVSESAHATRRVLADMLGGES